MVKDLQVTRHLKEASDIREMKTNRKTKLKGNRGNANSKRKHQKPQALFSETRKASTSLKKNDCPERKERVSFQTNGPTKRPVPCTKVDLHEGTSTERLTLLRMKRKF